MPAPIVESIQPEIICEVSPEPGNAPIPGSLKYKNGGSAWESNPPAILILLTFLGIYVNGMF
jgi:hypothetical protein